MENEPRNILGQFRMNGTLVPLKVSCFVTVVASRHRQQKTPEALTGCFWVSVLLPFLVALS